MKHDSTPFAAAPAKEPIPIKPIYVSGMAYAKVIDGMMNVGFYRDEPMPNGASQRVIVAKLVFSASPTTVARALAVNHAMLEGAMRDEAEQQRTRRRPSERESVKARRRPSG